LYNIPILLGAKSSTITKSRAWKCCYSALAVSSVIFFYTHTESVLGMLVWLVASHSECFPTSTIFHFPSPFARSSGAAIIAGPSNDQMISCPLDMLH